MTPPTTWDGFRNLRVARRVVECAGVTSLHLADPAGAPLPPFLPGQYLTLDLDVPGQAHAVVACYSLSSAPDAPTYRITVKGVPGGRASMHLAEQVREGALLRARAPMGRFVLDPRAPDPAVLVGGGIGVTPFVSMLHAASRSEAARDVFVVLGMRNGAEFPLAGDVQALAAPSSRVHLHVAFSRPRPGKDVLGRNHHSQGRLTVERLTRVLPPTERPYQFYVCGPPTMTASITAGLRDLGVPSSQVHVEAFGPATTRKLVRMDAVAGSNAAGPLVTFARSGKTVPWDPTVESLLYLGERHKVPIPYACAVGRCGTCLTKLLAGKVRYPVEPAFPFRPGTCLPCVAVPDGPVTIDA